MLRKAKIKRHKRRDAIVLRRYGLGAFCAHRRPTMLPDICRCSLTLFISIGVTMATTVGRRFDRSAAMRLIPDHTKTIEPILPSPIIATFKGDFSP